MDCVDFNKAFKTTKKYNKPLLNTIKQDKNDSESPGLPVL